MPASKQSIAGSLLQTVTRLCTTVGYGVATAIFGSVAEKPSTSGYYAHNAAEPYAATFWFAVGFAFLGLFLVPFLKITTQGHKGDTGRLKTIAESGSVLDNRHVVAGSNRTTEETDEKDIEEVRMKI
jgi:hypothetical protein